MGNGKREEWDMNTFFKALEEVYAMESRVEPSRTIYVGPQKWILVTWGGIVDERAKVVNVCSDPLTGHYIIDYINRIRLIHYSEWSAMFGKAWHKDGA